MDKETIQEMLRRRPFEPFEVCLSSGQVLEVRHPEFAFVLRSNMVIGDPITGRLGFCSLLHITSVRPLQRA